MAFSQSKQLIMDMNMDMFVLTCMAYMWDVCLHQIDLQLQQLLPAHLKEQA
jgi:hypothetical protein